MKFLNHTRGLNTSALYESLMEETKYADRLLVNIKSASTSDTVDVTALADFERLDRAFRSGKYIARAFYREEGAWETNVMARLYNGPLDCIQQIPFGGCLPKLARGQEVWAKCADGVVRCVAIYDPSLVGQFQSDAEPVTEYATASDLDEE